MKPAQYTWIQMNTTLHTKPITGRLYPINYPWPRISVIRSERELNMETITFIRARFELITAETTMIIVFWDVTPCSFVHRYQISLEKPRASIFRAEKSEFEAATSSGTLVPLYPITLPHKPKTLSSL